MSAHMLPSLSHLAARTAGVVLYKATDDQRTRSRSKKAESSVASVDLPLFESITEHLTDPVDVYHTLVTYELHSAYARKFPSGDELQAPYQAAVQRLANRPREQGGLNAEHILEECYLRTLGAEQTVYSAKSWRLRLMVEFYSDTEDSGKMEEAYYVFKQLYRLLPTPEELIEFLSLLTSKARATLWQRGGDGVMGRFDPQLKPHVRNAIRAHEREYQPLLPDERLNWPRVKGEDHLLTIHWPISKPEDWRFWMMHKFYQRIQDMLYYVELPYASHCYAFAFECEKRTLTIDWEYLGTDDVQCWIVSEWTRSEWIGSREVPINKERVPLPIEGKDAEAKLKEYVTETNVEQNGAVRKLQYPFFSGSGPYRVIRVEL